MIYLMPRKYQFPYELRHLIYFQGVAQHLHFRRAAEALGVAQPALSRQIAQLESALGVTLFNRTQRRVELTAAGETLLARSESILQSLQTIPDELHAVAQGQVGHVRVAFTGLAMATVLPGIIRGFARDYPGVRLELKESPTSAQIKALREGEIDCGFFHPETREPAGLKTKMLLSERNGLLLPSDHPLSKKSKVRLKDFASTPFVLFPRSFNPGFYDRILSAFSKSGISPVIAEEIWPRANGIGLVRAGLGATFITPSEAIQLPSDIVFRPLEGPTPESRLVIGWRDSSEVPPSLSAFTQIAKSGD
jgi:DNA-binding transcriptional LysR family regulator